MFLRTADVFSPSEIHIVRRDLERTVQEGIRTKSSSETRNPQQKLSRRNKGDLRENVLILRLSWAQLSVLASSAMRALPGEPCHAGRSDPPPLIFQFYDLIYILRNIKPYTEYFPAQRRRPRVVRAARCRLHTGPTLQTRGQNLPLS